ncbi:MAG: ABC transporter permease [Lentisphaeria bacterium]|nr:ABC transporter permease [Lentisphaeria bacterium]
MRRAGRMGVFLGGMVAYAVTPPWKPRLCLRRLFFIGAQSVLVIALTGAFTGMVLTLQGFYALSRFGSDAFIGPLVALALVRELGPVLAGLMVTGRGGSAITAEIGIMRIGEQLDAMELMGLNPFRYVVVPNLVAAVVAMPLLSAMFDVIGIWAGYLIGVRVLGVSGGTYLGEIAQYLETRDIAAGVWKSLSFGVIICWVSCYKGYTCGYGAEGVSRATTQGVVLSSVLILVWDYFMTSALF